MKTLVLEISSSSRLRRSAFLALCTFCMGTTGCATLTGVPPSNLKAPLISSDAGYTLPASCLDDAKIHYVYTRQQRNGWIDGALSCINQTYDTFVTELRRSETMWGISTGIADLVFKVASTLTPSAGVKANYAAASLLVTGTDEIVNKEAFLQQTVAALTAAMDANRKKALVPIIAGMQAEADEYPISLAYEHLLNYQRAGSFVEGLKFAAATAQAEGDKSTRDLESIPLNRALDETQSARRGCLTAVLQGLPATQQNQLYAAYQKLDSTATNPTTVKQLVADIIVKHRFVHDQDFDDRLVAEMKKQGLTVPCDGG